jgi:hypothetical protein
MLSKSILCSASLYPSHPFSLLRTENPCVYRSGRRVRTAAAFESSDNGRQNAYYVPEWEMVVKRYQELECDPTSLRAFMEHQKAAASQMMKVDIILKLC